MPERRLTTPFIVPLFIPHLGCPHRCVFCHQETITSQSISNLSDRSIREILQQAINSRNFDFKRKREVAFYGGTFTRLEEGTMKRLLGVVSPYLKQGLFSGIRISTRPDEIRDKKLELLRAYGVTTVELGAQSLDDEVLDASRRGHTALDTLEAARKLRQYAFKVGIQLMPGLPEDTAIRFRKTVDRVIGLQPDMVRLYPTVVIEGTALAQWFRQKKYRPLSLAEAVRICTDSCLCFEAAGIPVIRMGLMSSPSLVEEGQVVAGPWHEAFGFLVRSEIYHRSIDDRLLEVWAGPRILLRVHPRDIPLARGHRNSGIERIEEKARATVAAVIPDESVPRGRIRLESP